MREQQLIVEKKTRMDSSGIYDIKTIKYKTY